MDVTTPADARPGVERYEATLASADEDAPTGWAELAIVSAVEIVPDPAGDEAEARVSRAPGEKCARCWRVLPEVGQIPAAPALCARCADAVGSGLVCRAAE